MRYLEKDGIIFRSGDRQVILNVPACTDSKWEALARVITRALNVAYTDGKWEAAEAALHDAQAALDRCTEERQMAR